VSELGTKQGLKLNLPCVRLTESLDIVLDSGTMTLFESSI